MTIYNFNFTFDQIERIDAAETAEELARELAKVASRFGFEAAAIAAFPHPEIPFEKRILAHHWPHAWYERYLAQNYIEVDPVFAHSRTTSRPFAWSEARYDRNSKAARMMDEAAEHGFAAGFCVPTLTLHGPVNVTFGGSHSEMSREDRAMLHLAAVYAQIRATELLAEKIDDVANVLSLSPREREVLKWCADGKTTREIADVLGISPHTIITHINGACRKLGVPTRTAAVAKAVRVKLI
jgi:LuxR family quorum sensing-dependent transcriptional regulator